MTQIQQQSNLWVRCFHPSADAQVRLICFPHAGGSASFYFPLSRALPPWIEVLALQYPGRQDRRHEQPIGNLRELADHVSRELTPWLDLPVAFFGHSLGATLAFEVALRLQQREQPPSSLFVSGRRAPSRFRDERVHLADDQALLAQLANLDGTAPQLLGDEEALRMVLPALRGDYRAAETYRYWPGPRLTCPIHALTGDDDAMATLDEVSAWSEHTSAGFEMKVYGGGHFFLVDHATQIQQLIITELAKERQ
nr:alpha/beta fold hydrolase [Planobispora rosea]